jgi:hypothetical protein
MLTTLMDRAHGRYTIITSNAGTYEIDLDTMTLHFNGRDADFAIRFLPVSYEIEIDLVELTVGRPVELRRMGDPRRFATTGAVLAIHAHWSPDQEAA